jgi:hypothetical protein
MAITSSPASSVYNYPLSEHKSMTTSYSANRQARKAIPSNFAVPVSLCFWWAKNRTSCYLALVELRSFTIPAIASPFGYLGSWWAKNRASSKLTCIELFSFTVPAIASPFGDLWE